MVHQPDGSAFYLDHAATTAMRPEAIEAVTTAWTSSFGNASGTHAVAQRAKNALEDARERAAAILGIERPHDIVFTSGGTESDNLAVSGAAGTSGRRHIVVSAIEHKAVGGAAHALERHGYTVSEAGCGRDGIVTPEHVESVVGPDTAVVSVMAANNEIGTLQPIPELVAVVRERAPDAIFHTDAVQAFVGSPTSLASTGADLLSLSAHKFGGPTGVGLLATAPGVRIDPIVHGGGQEAGRRAGTSNVPGIVGMVAAMEAVERERGRFESVVGAERDAFEATLGRFVTGLVVNGAGSPRMPHFSHVRFPGIRAETILIRLDQEGVFAAAGSACQSGAVEPSHVLTAMGMTTEEAASCVRFSFGWDTAPGEGERAARAVAAVIDGLVPA
ncbi:MAG TPA: cysteine desulfurase family protein [Acidimicrobiia bacterium]|nr:cysteine desulfurase family protein [Acidimicrobiia bacterium]